ncbi:MAG: toll/interleukin-1 receptor domain-containing protein [Gammaproteobacteria bacterium]|nr:toll/interleukin-1 receptor domain-containing protein [Gammaproteobacteria bacterium]
MADKKRIQVNSFVSYAHTDDEYASAFIDEFKEMSAPSEKYEYVFWQDTEILPGENWKEEIREALKNCDLGLLLISPAFLGSKFIDAEELPKFVGDKAKPITPIMLKMVNLNRHNLKGLDSNQIFRLKVEGVRNLKSFAQCGSSQRTEFVYELFDKVEIRLDKLHS